MKVLELDIETAPNLVYTWGLFKQNIAINQIVEPGYTLCFAAKWQHEPRKKMVYYSVHHDGWPTMLDGLHKLLDAADAVVHYNGKKFDIPTINREFAKGGMAPPSPYKQIDLYSVVKRQFKFASNKLDFVASQLGLGCKVQHKGMPLWTACMAGDDKAWATMRRYNKRDVVLLGRLYTRLLPWITPHPNRGMYAKDMSKLRCPNCGSLKLLEDDVVRPANVSTYQAYRCTKCHTRSRGRLPIGVKPMVVP